MKKIRTSPRGWSLSCLRSRVEIPATLKFNFSELHKTHMKRYKAGSRIAGTSFLTLLIVFGCGLFACQTAFGRELDWQPQRTWVFVVGTLKWKHSDVFNSFLQKNRRDAQLVDFFRQQGVPENQLVYLQDSQATTRRVRASFATFLSQARPGDLLFFYYCGHGYKSDDERTTYFATYDAGDDVPGWPTNAVLRDIEKNFKGSRAILTADSCYSGTLAEQARRTNHQISYAVLTSASASELSTENWTFTEMLLAGLKGKPYADIDGDGLITLGEVAEGVQEDMSFAEEQQAAFITTERSLAGTALAAAPQKANSEISRRVEVRSEGDWYKARIIDARAGRFRVHYYGWEDSDDEWVLPRQIRKSKTDQYGAGAIVEVNWHGQWYSAKVLKVDREDHLIHYVGYDDSWDEWVSPERIRRP